LVDSERKYDGKLEKMKELVYQGKHPKTNGCCKSLDIHKSLNLIKILILTKVKPDISFDTNTIN
jgi:hypothetical protein